jgi:flagella synthesis protein FlgN
MNHVLDQITATLDQLSLLLQDEADRLKRRDIDDLDSLLTDKHEALQAVALADQQRTGLLARAGYEADADGMRRYLAQQNDPELQARWQKIVAQLQHVQIFNEANGRIIQRGLEQTGQMLDLLRGEEHHGASAYGPSGQTARSSGKTISRA